MPRSKLFVNFHLSHILVFPILIPGERGSGPPGGSDSFLHEVHKTKEYEWCD